MTEQTQQTEDQGQPATDTRPSDSKAPDDVKAQLAEITASLSKRDTELAEVKGALSALTSVKAPAAEPQRRAEPPPAPTKEMWESDASRAYELDQQRRQWFLANNIASVIEERDARLTQTEARQFDYELRLIRAGNEKVYDKLKPHMDKYLRDHPDERQPGNAERIFNLIRGENFETLHREMLEESKKEWVPPTGEGSIKGQPPKQDVKLNDEEYRAWRTMGARLGWSPEEYKRRKDTPLDPKDGRPGTYEEWKNRRERLSAKKGGDNAQA